MSLSDAEFIKSLRATFYVEAGEHLQAIATGLLELEKTPAPEIQRAQIATAFRAAHSLKGAARAVDFTDIESSCQSLEDMFAAWKQLEKGPETFAFDAAHRALNEIAAVLSAHKSPRGSPTSEPQAIREGSSPPNLAKSPPRSSETARSVTSGAPALFSDHETVRITINKLDARLVEAEEMLIAKLTLGQRVEDLRELTGHFESLKREWATAEPIARQFRNFSDTAVSNPIEHVQEGGLARLLDFIEWNRDHSKSLEERIAALTRVAELDRYTIGKLVDDLLENSKKLLLLPFATLAAPFPKLVRDLCRDQGKEANLVVRGEEIEVDKRILEEMKDPLVHLLRNSVDHGIEPPELRTRSNKASCATVTISVSPINGHKVEFLVADDGGGIDTEKVKEAAIRHGIITSDDARQLDDVSACDLVLQAGVSTSPLVTRVSGRGLGLAIVREKAEKLGGTVTVESRLGTGTIFRIVLPTMLATFRGVLVEANRRLFVFPTAQVERVVGVKSSEIHTIEGRETFSMDGRVTPWVRLADILNLPRKEANAAASAAVPVLVLGVGAHRVAFAVDAVLDEQEVLVKPLIKPLVRLRHIAGATVLGSGQVVPILNATDLLKSARNPRESSAFATPLARSLESKAVLVAEDSITSRMLIKSILESAGYKVKTAVDGMDAFTQLRDEIFDLVVSDVEMPRLDGFDLTARIRADKKLANLPVILVTALETREDRERGVDVGASAYIVKSRFDQSDLLDAVRRLV